MNNIDFWIGIAAFVLSGVLIMMFIGAIIQTLFSDESLFDLIESKLFYRLAVLALLLCGIYFGASIRLHLHSIGDSLQKIENTVISEQNLQNKTSEEKAE